MLSAVCCVVSLLFIEHTCKRAAGVILQKFRICSLSKMFLLLSPTSCLTSYPQLYIVLQIWSQFILIVSHLLCRLVQQCAASALAKWTLTWQLLPRLSKLLQRLGAPSPHTPRQILWASVQQASSLSPSQSQSPRQRSAQTTRLCPCKSCAAPATLPALVHHCC